MKRQYGKLSAGEARSLVREFPAREVVHTSKTGRLLDDEGNKIDERETVPWTYALGPFGSWPVTMADVDKVFGEHANTKWLYGESPRLGPVVCWKNGWGFQAIAEAEVDAGPNGTGDDD